MTGPQGWTAGARTLRWCADPGHEGPWLAGRPSWWTPPQSGSSRRLRRRPRGRRRRRRHRCKQTSTPPSCGGQELEKRRRKKRRKKPKSSSSRLRLPAHAVHAWKFGHHFHCSCFCSSCPICVSPEEYAIFGIFWEITSGHVSLASALLGSTMDTCSCVSSVWEIDFWKMVADSVLLATRSCVRLRGFFAVLYTFFTWRWTRRVRCLTMATLPLVMSAWCLQPVLDAAQVLFPCSTQVLTAMCGSKLEHGLQLVMAPSVARFAGR